MLMLMSISMVIQMVPNRQDVASQLHLSEDYHHMAVQAKHTYMFVDKYT